MRSSTGCCRPGKRRRSSMWESFFGFKKTPFSDSPDAKQLFFSQAWSQVKTRLEFCHPGKGLLLWFVVDDFDAAWKRAQALGAAIEEPPNTDNGTFMRVRHP